MKPLRLEITAFGPYVDTQTIDFERLGEHGLFLVHGPTGSGKSSILDAICFALFGVTSGGERDGKGLVTIFTRPGTNERRSGTYSNVDDGTEQEGELSAGAASVAAVSKEARPRTRVVFEFEHGGQRYTATRAPAQLTKKLRGEGDTYRQPDGSLERITGRAVEVLASGVTEMNAQIRELLRCDVDQFRQTVVLPQGLFRQVITDHASRRQILANIFDTDRYSQLTQRLKDKASSLRQQSVGMEQRRRQLLEGSGADNETELRRLAEEASITAKEAERAKVEADRVRNKRFEAQLAAKALTEQFEALEQLQRHWNELEATAEQVKEQREQRDRGRKASVLAGDARHLDYETQRHQKETQELQKAREQLAKAEEEALAALAAQEACELQRPELEAAQALSQRLEVLLPQMERLVERLTQRDEHEKVHAEAEKRLLAAKANLANTEGEIEKYEAERREKTSVLEGEANLREERSRLEGELESLTTLEELQSQIEQQSEQIAALMAEADPLDQLTAAVRLHTPGLLAAELNQGEPCLVCGSTEHPSPHPIGDQVEALERAFKKYGEASKELATLRQKKAGYEDEVTGLRNKRGWEEAVPERSGLEARRELTNAALEQVAAARRRSKEIDEALQQLNDSLPQLKAERDVATQTEAQAREALREIAGEIKSALAAIAPEHHDPDEFERARSDAAARLRELEAAFTTAEDRARAANEERKLARAHQLSCEGKVTSTNEALERLQEEFAEKLRRAGFVDRADLDAATLPESELDALDKQVADHEQAVATTRHNLKEQSEKLQDQKRPDMLSLDEAYSEANEALAEAENKWVAKRDAHASIAGKLGQLETLELEQGALRERAAAADRLSKLASGALSGHGKIDFETFVLQSIFHQVLHAGNLHLRHMTAGRYALHLRDSESLSERGLELDVSDHYGGGDTRGVETLSGGEGFLASLALALGLSEIAQQQSGATELGALFIDEGFGNLDSHTLEQVVGILQDLRHDHRMVGVISHVDELKRRIPVQLLIEKSMGGSQVRMRVNA